MLIGKSHKRSPCEHDMGLKLALELLSVLVAVIDPIIVLKHLFPVSLRVAIPQAKPQRFQCAQHPTHSFVRIMQILDKFLLRFLLLLCYLTLSSIPWILPTTHQIINVVNIPYLFERQKFNKYTSLIKKRITFNIIRILVIYLQRGSIYLNLSHQQSLSINDFFIILTMGCFLNSPQNSSYLIETNSRQIVEQNYSNNILFLTFNTLESIYFKLLGDPVSKDKKRFGNYDTIDYSSKTLPELIKQLSTHLFLLRVSKQQMQIEFGEYILPKEFQHQRAISEVRTLKDLCGDTEASKNTPIVSYCQDFEKILQGKYQNLCFDTNQVNVEYSAVQSQKHRSNLLQNGIKASLLMQKLKEQILNQNINDASMLSVKLNKLRTLSPKKVEALAS